MYTHRIQRKCQSDQTAKYVSFLVLSWMLLVLPCVFFIENYVLVAVCSLLFLLTSCIYNFDIMFMLYFVPIMVFLC